jgi:L-methionine (R)-S-oxide reductase
MDYIFSHTFEIIKRKKLLSMSVAAKIQDVRAELEQFIDTVNSTHDLMEHIVELLHKRMPKYNWVGFYLLEQAADGQPPMLVLGPFKGAPTPHTRIPLNQGICGAAASSGKTVVVDNVAQDPRYLACSLETKSEIVAPLFVHGKVVGELDIDSHSGAAFQDEDRELVEFCAMSVGKHWEKPKA